MNKQVEFENQDISLNELFFILRSNSLILYLSIVICLLASLLYLFLVNPTYSSEGSIIVESENSTVTSMFDMGLGKNLNFLENEIEILKSRTTSERTINKLLNSDMRDNMFLFDTKRYNYGWLPGKGLRGVLRTVFLLDYNETQILNIQESINDSLFNIFTDELSNNLSISNLRNTDVLVISYEGPDPDESALIINTLIDVYKDRDQEWATDEMSHLKSFLSKQLEIKKIELDDIEQKLKIFQENEHIYSLDNNSQMLLNQLTNIEMEYYATLSSRNILIERKKYFQNSLNEQENKFSKQVSNTLNSQLFSIREELSILEAEYILIKSKHSDEHPAAKDLVIKIDKLKKELQEQTNIYIQQGIAISNPIEFRQALMDSVIQINASIEGHNSKLNEVGSLVSQYEVELSELPSKFLVFSRLHRDKAILDETYNLMKQKFEESRITEASQLGKVRVLDPAVSSKKPISPDKSIVLLIGLILGISTGISIILFKEYLDSTIKSIEEIERRGLSVLAIIPAIGQDAREKRKKKKGYKLNLKSNGVETIERRLLTYEDPKSPIAEAYRSLRTSLMFNYDKVKDSKTILVSSSGPGEGKTTTVANLAITYANMGKKTLLIDADLRKPVIHKMFKLDKNEGLTSFLGGIHDNIDNLISKSDVDNLSLIPAGIVPPNPSELLGSSRMLDFLDKAKDKFEIILFDSPPLIAVTDAVILRKFADKFILVVRASGTEKGALDRVLANLININQNIDGVVFNGVSETSSYGAGYYYNYYQYYYGSD